MGDEVFGMINFIGHAKVHAEYVAVPASQLALKPKNISSFLSKNGPIGKH
ncbi:hypothetical protein [Dysgonomonas sp. ZJ279]|nr:hypothetical protein [Dysgonomonas sp. ZJ279]